MNHFIKISSDGGYIGRFFWRNSGIHKELPHFGELCFLQNNILNVTWAGELWAIRSMIK